MFRVHLRETTPTEYRTTFQDDQEVAKIKQLIRHLYDHGFMLINTCSGALSTAMEQADVDRLADTMEKGLQAIA